MTDTTTDTLTPTVDVRRADDRLRTRIDRLDSRHSFSFGHHWDPASTHHGLLLVNNDHIVTAGADAELLVWEVHATARDRT